MDLACVAAANQAVIVHLASALFDGAACTSSCLLHGGGPWDRSRRSGSEECPDKAEASSPLCDGRACIQSRLSTGPNEWLDTLIHQLFVDLQRRLVQTEFDDG